MNARIEAAARAIHEAGDWEVPFGDDWRGECARNEASAALAAADTVMFSDEAIERAAKAVHDLGSKLEWTGRSEEIRELYREDVHAVVAALRDAPHATGGAG